MLTLAIQHLIAFLIFYAALIVALPGQHVLNSGSQSFTRNLTVGHILTPSDRPLITTLQFDDLHTTTSGLGRITDYNHLTFSSFNLVNVSSAASSHLISPSDRTCATSYPNILTASRHANPSIWPRFALHLDTARSHGLSPYFHFSGLAMQPMNNTPSNTLIYINAYGIDSHKNVTSFHSMVGIYRKGFNQSHPSNFTSFWPGWGRDVNMVEIYAQTFEGEDVDFCIDNLMLEFTEAGSSSAAPALRPTIQRTVCLDFDHGMDEHLLTEPAPTYGSAHDQKCFQVYDDHLLVN